MGADAESDSAGKNAPPNSNSVSEHVVRVGSPSEFLGVIFELKRALFCRLVGLRRSVEDVSDRRTTEIRRRHASPLRKVLRRGLRHRPGVVEVPPGELLMGCQAGLDAIAFAEAVKSVQFVGLAMRRSPHVEILQLWEERNGRLSNEDVRSSHYWEFAQQIREVTGRFFGARTDDEVLSVTRNFAEWGRGDSPRTTLEGGSSRADKVLVAAVTGASTFQVVDGHHRVAVAIVRGEAKITVQRTWLSMPLPTVA